MKFVKKVSLYLYENHSQNIHALKYAIAFGLGYLAMLMLTDTYSFWILITIAVVMSTQPVIGQLLQKSFFRIIGTIVGVVLGVATFYLPHDPIIVLVIVMFVSFFISRFLTFHSDGSSQVAILGLVTFTLISLLPQTNMHFALMRLIDTAVGILICFVVSFFIFPYSSRRALISVMRSSADHLRTFIEIVFIKGADRREDSEATQVENYIIQKITKMRGIIRTGNYEKFYSRKQKYQFNQLIRYFRAVYHYLLLIDIALREIMETSPTTGEKVMRQLEPVMQQLNSILHDITSGQMKTLPDCQWQHLELQGDFSKITVSQIGAIDFGLQRIPFCLSQFFHAWQQLQK